MICIKCNKFYIKKKYLENHIKKGDCIKQAEKISIKKTRNEPEIIIDKEDEFVAKVVKKDDDDDLRKKYEIVLLEIELLKERIETLEKNSCGIPEKIIKNENQENIDKYIEENIKIVKKERMNIDDETIRKHLNAKSLESDCELLFKYYLENTTKNLYPIKKNKKSECYFWNGTDWVEDIGGNNLKSIFTNNLRKVYSKVNNSKDVDFLSNQEYINNLSSKKTQYHLYSYFKETYL